MFISVNADNLNESSKSIPFKLNSEVKIKKERINIKIVRKESVPKYSNFKVHFGEKSTID